MKIEEKLQRRIIYMSKRNKKRRLVKYSWVLIIFFIISAVLIPLAVNHLLQKIIQPDNYLKPNEWLSFWGSYLGGLLGSVAALLALNESRCQAERQHKESEDNRRLSVLPALNIAFEKDVTGSSKQGVEDQLLFYETQSNHYFGKKKIGPEFDPKSKTNKSVTGILRFTNCGMGPALQICITYDDIKSSYETNVSVGAGLTSVYALTFVKQEEKSNKKFKFTIHYNDVLGNRYNQQQFLIYDNKDGTVFFESSTPPELQEETIYPAKKHIFELIRDFKLIQKIQKREET